MVRSSCVFLLCYEHIPLPYGYSLTVSVSLHVSVCPYPQGRSGDLRLIRNVVRCVRQDVLCLLSAANEARARGPPIANKKRT